MAAQPVTRRRNARSIPTFSPGRRRAAVVGALALALLGTAGCAAGRQAQTAYESPAIDAGGGVVGRMLVQDVSIVAPASGSYPQNATAQLSLVIVNTGATDETLVGVTSPDAASSSLYGSSADAAAAAAAGTSSSSAPSSSASASSSSAPASGASSAPASPSTSAAAPSASASAPAGLTSLTIPAGQRVTIGLTSADKVLELSGLTRQLYPGVAVAVTFHFADAGDLTVQVPVALTPLPSDPASVAPEPTESSAA